MNKTRNIIIIVFISFLAFSNSLNNELIGDSKSFLEGESFYKDTKNLALLFDQSFIMNPAAADFTGYKERPISGCISYRPVTAVTFFADAWVWGERAFGYHLTNIFLHILAAILLFFLIGRMADPGRQPLAFLAALLFAAHPVQLEAVNCVGYRSDLLVAIFFILAMLFYDTFVRRNQIRYGVAACLAAFLALFAKESALTLPAVIGLYHIFFLPHDGAASLFKKRKLFYLALAAICAFHLFIYFVVFPSGYYPKFFNYGTNWAAHAAMTARIFFEYLVVLFLPFKISILPPLYAPAMSPLPVFKITAVAVFFLFLAVYFFRRGKKRDPFVAFGAAWFLITYLPGSNILPLPNPFAFRFLYLPMAGFAMAAAGLLLQAAGALKSRFPQQKWHIILPGGVVALCLLTTISFNEFFKNNITACREMIRRYPESSRPYWILGLSYLERGEKGKAEEYFKQYLQKAVNNPFLLAAQDDFLAYHMLSRCFPDGAPEAVAHLQKAITLRPEYLAGHLDLSRAFIMGGNFEKAYEAALQAVRLNADAAAGYVYAAHALIEMGRMPEAARYLEAAQKLSPQDANVRYVEAFYRERKK